MTDIYQNYAGYRPPSVHISRVKEVTPQPAGVVRQVPLIIGQGPSIKSIEAVITKGEGDKDTLLQRLSCHCREVTEEILKAI